MLRQENVFSEKRTFKKENYSKEVKIYKYNAIKFIFKSVRKFRKMQENFRKKDFFFKKKLFKGGEDIQI